MDRHPAIDDGGIMRKRDETPRYRRDDIISRLRKGAQKRIARQVGCHPSLVSKVLNGKVQQHKGINKEILSLAARNAKVELDMWD